MDTKVKMAKSSQKLFVVMLVLVLVLGLLVSSTNARRLAMARGEVVPTMMHSIESKWSSIGDNRVNFGMLPKGDIIPPSGPSTRTSDEPPPPPPLSLPLTLPPPSPLDNQMLPEGAGDARRLAMAREEVVPTMMHSIESKWSSIGDNRVNFGMLPKGDIIPPSGPSTRTSDEPPPPPPLSLPLTLPPPSPLDNQMLPEGAGDARRLAMAGEEVVAAMMRLVEGKWSPSKDKRVRFGMLPKNKGLPSSGSLKGINNSSMAKEVVVDGHVPPLGPSTRTSDSPPPPPHNQMLPQVKERWSPYEKKRVDFGMLPKGNDIPPSGPSTRIDHHPTPPPL
ncbi:hypothetical protein F0562_017017 [Nyssa sinensis]|uniref:Uncharacterized protein n=1 Tax=Nyssa sinensis TaxID=561372 RepID=A0A5J4ZGU9_9ASTE|nr:hypothetical protein F0562_017017 [Nyssa sinensis]